MPHCYSCDKEVSSLADLSPRRRCVSCEYRRSLANENENDELRAALASNGIFDPTTLPRYAVVGSDAVPHPEGLFVRLDDLLSTK